MCARVCVTEEKDRGDHTHIPVRQIRERIVYIRYNKRAAGCLGPSPRSAA